MVGVGGAWRSSDCHHGAFAGGRLGVPIRLFASRPPWELDRDGAPTFYLVPQLDAVRYLNPGGLDAEPSWQLSAGLVLRVFVWTRLEP